MARFAQVIFMALLLLIPPTAALAGPAEDANAAIDRWSAAYSGNDPEIIAVIIGRMQYFSELSVPLYPRELRQS
jgi:hypothetical protein